MRVQRAEAQNNGQMHFSRFGPEANLFEELETLFRVYGESGKGKVRNYLHDEEEAAPYNQEPGTFTPWQEIPPDTDIAKSLWFAQRRRALSLPDYPGPTYVLATGIATGTTLGFLRGAAQISGKSETVGF
jgi:hypothetical protein